MAIITLSRWTFSGARELGQQISERLGYRFVSRDEILSKTAGYGMSGERMQQARRRRFGFLQRVDLEWSHYLIYARAALTKEIRQGSLIYLGSNGRALLRDFPNVLHVGVVADMEYRTDNLITRTDYVIDPKNARKLIQKIDETKARWRRTLHDEHLLGASSFDLLIDPGETTLDDACDLIQATLEQTQYQTTYKTLEAIELLTVAAELRARIAMRDEIIDDNVNVEVQDGIIVIRGSVHSAEALEGIKELLYRPEVSSESSSPSIT